MAMSKTLCRSVAIQHGGDVAGTARAFNAEIFRDNPEMLFVTAVFGVLDLRDGTLDYCNAGHEPPWRLAADGAASRPAEGGGPPFSVIEGYPYAASRWRLFPGDRLVLVTDGVTEATNPGGALFGGERLRQCLEQAGTASPAALCQALRKAVAAFQEGTLAEDDVTVLALRWKQAG
jgi:serine phosphatase RsbU (regulator of sigma subunit)